MKDHNEFCMIVECTKKVSVEIFMLQKILIELGKDEKPNEIKVKLQKVEHLKYGVQYYLSEIISRQPRNGCIIYPQEMTVLL